MTTRIALMMMMVSMVVVVSRPVASSTSASVRHFLMHPLLSFSLLSCLIFRVLFILSLFLSVSFFEGPLLLRCLPFRFVDVSKRRDKTRGPWSPSWTSRREERRLACPIPLLLPAPPRPKPFMWRREDVAEDASLKTSAGKPLCGFPRAQSDD